MTRNLKLNPVPVRPEGDHNYVLKESRFERHSVCSRCEGIITNFHATVCPHCGADKGCFFEAAVLHNTWEYTVRDLDPWKNNFFKKHYRESERTVWTYGGWKFIETCDGDMA